MEETQMNNEVQNSTVLLSRISWLAYVSEVISIRTAIVAVIVYAIYSFTDQSILYPSIIAGLYVLFMLYNIIWLRTIKLFYDDQGIWLYRGILPWNKGSSGVKWRDLDEAVYFTGFFSWLFKSYKIKLGHRFTKANELMLPYMHRGNNAVLEINNQHKLRAQER